MPLSSSFSAPVRGYLIDLNTGQEMGFPMNPTTFSESIKVNWAKQNVLGMSHPIQQYMGTDAHMLPSVSFRVDGYKMASELGAQPSRDDLDEFKRFCMSLTVPPAGSQDVVGGSPPRVLFVWPNVVSLVTVIHQVDVNHIKFRSDGASIIHDVIVTFGEIRDLRMTSEDLLNTGSLREGG